MVVTRARQKAAPDARHRPLMAEIEWFYRASNDGLPMPDPGRTARAVKRFLDGTPAWPLDTLLLAVRNRFFSRGVNNAAPAYLWIRDLAKWAAAPLNKWGQPLGEDAMLRQQMEWWREMRAKRAEAGG